jgi:uncharacterized OB-fold protein
MDINPAQIKRKQSENYQYLGKIGKVVAFTSVAVGPKGLEKHVPYVVALIDFSGKRISLPLTDVKAADVKTGMRVKGVLRRMMEPKPTEIIVYGVKCAPIDN